MQFLFRMHKDLNCIKNSAKNELCKLKNLCIFSFAIIGLQSNAVLSSSLVVVCCIQKGFWGTAFDFYPIIYYWTMFKKHEIPGFDFEFHLKFQGLNICMGLIMWSLWSTKIYKRIVLIPMIEMALNSSFWIIYTLYIIMLIIRNTWSGPMYCI